MNSGPCVRAVFVSSRAVYSFVLATMPMFQNGVRQGEME